MQQGNSELPDLSLRHFVREAIAALWSWDGRFWRSLRDLVLRPGWVARQHWAAGDSPYLHPVRLYVIVNVVFFLLAPMLNSRGEEGGTGKIEVWNISLESAEDLGGYHGLVSREIARSGLSESVFRALFDEKIRTQQGALIFSVIPFFGLFLWAILRRRRRFLVEHLVYVTSLGTAMLVMLLVVGATLRAIVAFGQMKPVLWVGVPVVLCWLGMAAYWLFQGARIYYDIRTWWGGLLLAAFQVVVLTVLITAYVHLGFWAALFSLRLSSL